MRPVRRFYVGSHPCQGYRKTSYNGWDWGLLSTGSLKFRELEPDEANGEDIDHHKEFCLVAASSPPRSPGPAHNGDDVWTPPDGVNPLPCGLGSVRACSPDLS